MCRSYDVNRKKHIHIYTYNHHAHIQTELAEQNTLLHVYNTYYLNERFNRAYHQIKYTMLADKIFCQMCFSQYFNI